MNDAGLLKRLVLFLISAAILTIGSGLGISWWVGAKLDAASWAVFTNAKLPLMWTQVTTALLTVFVVNLMTPNCRTISVIMDLNGDKDIWQNRAVACTFLLGMGWLAAFASKGGF